MYVDQELSLGVITYNRSFSGATEVGCGEALCRELAMPVWLE